MTACIITGAVMLIVGVVAGWKSRQWKEEFDRDIEKAFEDALRNNE